jgi:hypothetical protein
MPSAESNPSTSPPARSPGLVAGWVGALLPPVAWLGDFLLRYFVVRWTNIHDRRWPAQVSAAIAVLLVLVGAGLSLRARHAARSASTSGNPPGAGSTVATLSSWGLALAAYFLLLVLAETYPTFILSAREIT